MTEDEIEVVAEELAKAGGLSWYPGRQHSSLLKIVSDRYRDRARLAIAALDRYRAQKASGDSIESVETEPLPVPARGAITPDRFIQTGATVIYRPPGERRAYPCRVERVEGGQAYLMPRLRAWTGWVPMENLSRVPASAEPHGGGPIKECSALYRRGNTVGKPDAPNIVTQENSPHALQERLSLTDDVIEVVALELAKAGGMSCLSGQERGLVKLIMDRYRDRARLAIASLDRLRMAKQSPGEIKVEQPGAPAEGNVVSEGSLVLYCPLGDKRTYPCRVEKVEGSRLYVVPELPTYIGWVDLTNLSSPAIQ